MKCHTCEILRKNWHCFNFERAFFRYFAVTIWKLFIGFLLAIGNIFVFFLFRSEKLFDVMCCDISLSCILAINLHYLLIPNYSHLYCSTRIHMDRRYLFLCSISYFVWKISLSFFSKVFLLAQFVFHFLF